MVLNFFLVFEVGFIWVDIFRDIIFLLRKVFRVLCGDFLFYIGGRLLIICK